MKKKKKKNIRPGSDHHDSQIITTTMTITMTTTAKILTMIFMVSALWSAAEAQVRVLTPPYFNLAFGKNIVASSTCGVNSSSPELFCRLTGVAGDTKESDQRITINSGQLCEECDPSVESLSHYAELAIDGTERWWQSPPLSRGMEYNEVNVTIDLEQVSLGSFHESRVLCPRFARFLTYFKDRIYKSVLL